MFGLSMEQWLCSLGARATRAEKGEDALALLAHESFDLVLMDIQMPGMNGLEGTKAIRAGTAGEQVKNIPIVALSAYAEEKDKDRALASGMNEYLPKPVNLDKLVGILKSMLATQKNNPIARE